MPSIGCGALAIRPNCFLNRNSKDFLTADIQEELRKHECLVIPSFDDGVRFVQTQISEHHEARAKERK